MKLIVAGGRDLNDEEMVWGILDQLASQIDREIEEVVCGGASGADALGKRWAEFNNISVGMFPADWDTHGKAAGYRRNVDMANHADVLYAFWDGSSKGTKHMIDIMKKKQKPYCVFNYSGQLTDWGA